MPAKAVPALLKKADTKKPAPKRATPAEPKAPKLPKTLAECADMLYKIRQERYAKDKESAALKAQESALTTHIIDNLPKSNATGVAGKVARVSVVSKTIPRAVDWDLLQAYVLKNGKKNPGVFGLFQRRLGEATVSEMWAAGETVPGVEPMDVKTVSLNKL